MVGFVVGFGDEGVSRKGSGLTLGGVARGGGGGLVSVGSSAFRESALGEATARAVDALAGELAERRGRFARQERCAGGARVCDDG